MNLRAVRTAVIAALVVWAYAIPVTGQEKIGGLIQQLKDGDEQAVTMAVSELGRMGAPAVGPLIAALTDKDPRVRAGAARALGEIKDTRAVGPLFMALTDKESKVQDEALQAVAGIKDPRVLAHFMVDAKSADPMRRHRGVEGLGTWTIHAPFRRSWTCFGMRTRMCGERPRGTWGERGIPRTCSRHCWPRSKTRTRTFVAAP